MLRVFSLEGEVLLSGVDAGVADELTTAVLPHGAGA